MAAQAAQAVPRISVFKAARESKKGEDAAAIVNPTQDVPAAFAIFDGHSGKDTAKFCSTLVCGTRATSVRAPLADDDAVLHRSPFLSACHFPRRSANGCTRPVHPLPRRKLPTCYGRWMKRSAGERPSPKRAWHGATAIAPAHMWLTGPALLRGRKGCRDGATATLLFVEAGDEGGFKCTFAWCGDSSAVVCDTSAEAGTVLFATESHTAGPDHQEGGRWQKEKVMLEFFAKVRKAIEGTGVDTLAATVSLEEVVAAVDSVGEPIPEGFTREEMVRAGPARTVRTDALPAPPLCRHSRCEPGPRRCPCSSRHFAAARLLRRRFPMARSTASSASSASATKTTTRTRFGSSRPLRRAQTRATRTCR
jgi:serine/threonine protein phosphatase PrpC